MMDTHNPSPMLMTAQFSVAHADNVLRIEQGYMAYV